jgi:hypothetical protein
MNFDIHCHALLIAVGYSHEHVEESWEDVGGPESGPKLVGGPAADIYWLEESPTKDHQIVVVRGEIVEMEYVPAWGRGLEM